MLLLAGLLLPYSYSYSFSCSCSCSCSCPFSLQALPAFQVSPLLPALSKWVETKRRLGLRSPPYLAPPLRNPRGLKLAGRLASALPLNDPAPHCIAHSRRPLSPFAFDNEEKSDMIYSTSVYSIQTSDIKHAEQQSISGLGDRRHYHSHNHIHHRTIKSLPATWRPGLRCKRRKRQNLLFPVEHPLRTSRSATVVVALLVTCPFLPPASKAQY